MTLLEQRLKFLSWSDKSMQCINFFIFFKLSFFAICFIPIKSKVDYVFFTFLFQLYL